MSLPVFYSATIPAQNAEFELAGDEGRHAALVRRFRIGEEVVVTDGLGSAARCEVLVTGRDKLGLRVLQQWVEPSAALQLTVVQALAKGDRADQALEGLTEVGADRIVPWAAAHCVVQWQDASTGLPRWQRVVQAAAKQSRRIRWPELVPAVSLTQLAAIVAEADLALVLHENAETAVSEVVVPQVGSIVLIVGPEGGITADELSALVEVGARPVRLGPTVFRTATAGLAGSAAILSRTERWDAK